MPVSRVTNIYTYYTYIYTHTQICKVDVDPQNGSPCYFSGQFHNQPCTFFETLEPGDGEEKGNDAFAEGRETAWISTPSRPSQPGWSSGGFNHQDVEI